MQYGLSCRLCMCFYALLVMVWKEDCESDGDGVVSWLANNTVTVLPLSCHAASLPSSPLPSHPTKAHVVLASCETMSSLASSMGVEAGNKTRSIQGSFSPLLLLPVPSDSYTCGRLTQISLRSSVTALCHISFHPLRRVVDLTLSWLIYHSWNAFTLLYDTSLDLTSHITIGKIHTERGKLLSFMKPIHAFSQMNGQPLTITTTSSQMKYYVNTINTYQTK